MGWGLLTVVTSAVTLVAATAAIYDAYLARSVKKATPADLPIRIRRSVSYGSIYDSFRKFREVLDNDRFIPDVIVGIHYEGTSLAAILGKILYKPVVTARVRYEHRGSRLQHLEEIDLMCDEGRWLEGKNVLVLDNSIKTGETLEAVSRLVDEYARSVRTLVVYRDMSKGAPRITPDYLLFFSKRHLLLVK